MTTRITGTGSCLPVREVTNQELSTIMETTDEWIRSRTGIVSRRIATTETTTSMSIHAGKEAMRNAGVTAEQIDLIIVGTISADLCLPSTACEIQAAIGAVNAIAFDINAACSGFVFAMNTAHAYISMGIYQTALIIGAETLSKMMDWNDRSTCVLFGDGAGAAVIQASDTNRGILAIRQGSDGLKGNALICQDRPVNNPFVKQIRDLQYVAMDGQEVFKFVLKTIPNCIKELVKEAGFELSDIKYFILHQANMRIIDGVSRRLGIPMERFPTDLEQYGNMSAASVPVLLHEVNQKGMLIDGDLVVISAFGAGLTWGAALLRW